MNIPIVLAVFVVVCITLIAGQRDDCEQLKRACDSCVNRPENAGDRNRNLPTLNRECRRRTRNTWVWRDINRCELTRLNCLGSDRRMNCGDIAELARMRRVRN